LRSEEEEEGERFGACKKIASDVMERFL